MTPFFKIHNIQCIREGIERKESPTHRNALNILLALGVEIDSRVLTLSTCGGIHYMYDVAYSSAHIRTMHTISILCTQ